MFVTTHYMDEAERCSRVAYIYLAKLIALGRPQDLKCLPEITPEGSGWFEITSQDATRLLPRLRGHPCVVDATTKLDIWRAGIKPAGNLNIAKETVRPFGTRI